mmetsp:Transcript_29979/g.71994  ORF Transcript_29979/g.71994 Transcript_29979/m.71994 type:complete len:364 (+) Transcript_29979:265-1356(+)
MIIDNTLKMTIALLLSLAILLPTHASAETQLLRRRLQSSDTFCWKDTHGRGAGTFPTSCPPGEHKIGALCYKPCPIGYDRKGVDCHQTCPNGFTDDGLFCRLDEYGRGSGYPWKFGDPPFHSSGQFHRCEHDHGKGNCEENGAIVYPKCKSGYHAFGCCICRPHAPDCSFLGLGGQVDLSCAKKIVLGEPTIINGCPTGKEYQAGLCYDPCDDGFHGVGPVCWSNTPNGWVNCGAGDAATTGDCVSAISTQVTSVVQSAVKIVGLLTGEVEVDVAEDVADLSTFKKLLKAFKLLLSQEPKLKKIIDDGKAGTLTPTSLLEAENLTNPADITRFAASIASFFDPTGISGIVAAYSYPTCSAVSS